jgi:hypothetical protein
MKHAELYCWLIINPTKIFPTIVQQKKHQLGSLEHLELQQASVQYLSGMTMILSSDGGGHDLLPVVSSPDHLYSLM